MDMYQKRKMRKEKNKQEDLTKTSVGINYYPGHMAKTKRLIKEKYDLIDIVYEVIDSRIPYSSKIKDIDELLKNKPRILIMTKKDLCDLKETLKWKKYYENKMVDDIRDIFVRNGIDFVKTNVYLHKIDKSGNYPLDLGDYDVIAIDDIKKIIWIIESKYISRVASFFEMYSQQKNFFLEHKYDEKFQKRIDFLSVNYKKVLKSLGFNDVTNYRISPYMVFNKVFMSRYKHIEFPIISIIELEDEIKK